MINSRFRKFIKGLKRINLSDNEKAQKREAILNFIKENPVKNNVIPNFSYSVQKVSWNWSALFYARLSVASSVAIFLFISVAAASGISISANKALPGDLLYGVKVNINEEVKGWLATTDQAKTDWEIERVQKRLEEAEELASKGELNTKNRAVIEANINDNSEKVEKRIAKLENEDNLDTAIEVGSNLETSLNAHAKILSKLTEDKVSHETKEEVKPIEVKVRTRSEEVKKNREKIESKISAQTEAKARISAENKLKVAESKFEEAKKMTDSSKASLSSEAKLEADIKLEAIQTTIDYGKAKLKAKAYSEASVAFQKSINLIQEAQLFAKAKRTLDIDVETETNVGGGKEESQGSDDYDTKIEVTPKVEIKNNLDLKVGL